MVTSFIFTYHYKQGRGKVEGSFQSLAFEVTKPGFFLRIFKGKEGYKTAEDHKGGRKRGKMGEIILDKNYF